MATYTLKGATTGPDTKSLNHFKSSEPAPGDIYVFDGLAGTDTLYLAKGTTQYLDKFPRANFTIGTVDANGWITVSGASMGGTSFQLQLKDVETLVFAGNTAVTLSYGGTPPPPPPPPPTDTTPPAVAAFSPADGATAVAVDSNIVVTFNESIQRGVGVIEIHSGSAAGPVVESYDAATSANLTVS